MPAYNNKQGGKNLLLSNYIERSLKEIDCEQAAVFEKGRLQYGCDGSGRAGE